MKMTVMIAVLLLVGIALAFPKPGYSWGHRGYGPRPGVALHGAAIGGPWYGYYGPQVAYGYPSPVYGYPAPAYGYPYYGPRCYSGYGYHGYYGGRGRYGRRG